MQKNSLIKKNILKYIDYKGISKYKFYHDTGITRGILDQNNGMSEENTAKFLAYCPDINSEWLLTGYGEMLKKTVEKSDKQSIVGDYNQQAGYNIKNNEVNIKELMNRISELKQQIENKDNIINNLMRQQELLINKLTEKL